MVNVSTHMPSSGEKVELVDANKWADMPIDQLFDQHIILSNRYATASQYGNPNMLKMIQMGIAQLDAIIKYKEQQKRKNIDKRQRDLTGLI